MNNIDVFIIAGGKCGSSTLKQTFVKQRMKTIKSHNPNCFKKQFGFDGFFNTIVKSSIKKKLIILDAYRTPIERKISSFFHNGEKKIPNFLKLSTKEQIKLFNNKYLYEIENQHIINEIYKKFKLPNTKKYNFTHKYYLHEINNLIFIKLHYNDIKNWGPRLSNIFQVPITIHKDNISSEKKYYKSYKVFLQEYTVPKKYLTEELIKDEEFKKFQTPQEQQDYIKMWLKKCH